MARLDDPVDQVETGVRLGALHELDFDRTFAYVKVIREYIILVDSVLPVELFCDVEPKRVRVLDGQVVDTLVVRYLCQMRPFHKLGTGSERIDTIVNEIHCQSGQLGCDVCQLHLFLFTIQ